jgi:hypothetical protein
LGSKNGGNLFEWLHNWQLLKKFSALYVSKHA